MAAKQTTTRAGRSAGNPAHGVGLGGIRSPAKTAADATAVAKGDDYAALLAKLAALQSFNDATTIELREMREREMQAREREEARRRLADGAFPIGHGRTGEQFIYARSGGLGAYTYSKQPMQSEQDCLTDLQMRSGICLTVKEFKTLMAGGWSLVDLRAFLLPPPLHEAKETMSGATGVFILGSMGYKGYFRDRACVFAAIKNVHVVAVMLLGPLHPWSIFILRLLAVLENMAVGYAAPTKEDLWMAWRCVLSTNFMSKESLVDRAVQEAALRININDVRAFATIMGNRPTELKAEPKGARGGPPARRRSRSPQPANRRRSRSRDRGRAGANAEQKHHICRDFNAPKGCHRAICKFEHVCSECEREGHARGSGRCHGRHH